MIYELDINKQREQVIKVIDYLISKGLSQKDIGARLGVDNIYLSHIRSGAIKNITPELVENLHEEFGINPDYIYFGSELMIDIPQSKYEHFEKFVDKWELINHGPKSYLHFSMDENFYNFLIAVYAQKEITINLDNSEEMMHTFTQSLTSLKKHFSTKAKNKEYVLIPADIVDEVGNQNVNRRKNLNEVLKILDIYSTK